MDFEFKIVWLEVECLNIKVGLWIDSGLVRFIKIFNE